MDRDAPRLAGEQGFTREEAAQKPNMGGEQIIRRIADPQEIGNAALFLASDESSFCTGANLMVDAGWTGSSGPGGSPGLVESRRGVAAPTPPLPGGSHACAQRRSKLAVAVAGVVAAGVGAGVAVSAIPSPDGTIGACYRKASGALRVVNTGADGTPSCAANEKPLTWSQRGPEGATGPQGPRGPAGRRGRARPGSCSACASAHLPGGQTAVDIGGDAVFR